MNRAALLVRAVCATLAVSSLQAQDLPAGTRVLDDGLQHLGDSVVKTWEPLVPAEPQAKRYELVFDARANKTEYVLYLSHRDVDNGWDIRLNGEDVALLKRGKAMVRQYYVVAAGVLRNGKNKLTVEPRKASDDIIIGKAAIYEGSLRDALDLRPLVVEVRHASDESRLLPAKVTVVRAGSGEGEKALAQTFFAEREDTAVRQGIVYTADGRVTCELPAGRYTVYASKGPEWSAAWVDVSLADDGGEGTTVVLRPEVDTTGWIAADAHIHTLTYSGHGDSNVEERVVTLAAEGVEMAIATDHNHNTDYRPVQKKLGMQRHFTSVTGNEVTTPVGHMNSFPLDPRDDVPQHKLKDWTRLVDGIRAKGAQVVILNHPRWPQIPTGPFGKFGLDRKIGTLPGQSEIPFDGMELVNSTTLQPNPMYLVNDWFALLNHGVRIGAVGTSDSHTVGDPVGQARTYVPSKTDDPARIDVQDACSQFRKMRTTVSLGLFCELAAGEDLESGVGSTVRPNADGKVRLAFRVAAPGWVTPRRAVVFVDGVAAAEHGIASTEGQATDETLEFAVGVPAPHDSWIVCAAFGDGIEHPFWPTQKSYTFAGTNPIWVEADGRRGWSSPRETAERIVAGALKAGGKLADRLARDLADADEAVQLQALASLRDRWIPSDAKKTDESAHAAAWTRLAEVAGALSVDAGRDWVQSQRR